jgi:AAA domain
MGSYKTFVADDLAVAVMTKTPIFGSEIDRCGGTLFYAAEGETEVAIRIQAAIEKRCSGIEEPPVDPKRAPFAWLTPEKLPLCLLDPKSVAQFAARARRIDAEMQARFGVPLTLIIIDTVVATAGYRKLGDENDATIGTRLMKDGLAVIARGTHTFALGVDHFGKDAETGTRGASSKEDNSDAVLAALGTKDITGIVTNPRLVVRKVRGGIAGREYPFSPRIVEVGKETTLVIDWAKPDDEAKRQAWNRALGKANRLNLICCRTIDDVEWVWLGGKRQPSEEPKE